MSDPQLKQRFDDAWRVVVNRYGGIGKSLDDIDNTLIAAERRYRLKQQEFFKFQGALFMVPEISDSISHICTQLNLLKTKFDALQEPLRKLYAESREKDLFRWKHEQAQMAARALKKSMKSDRGATSESSPQVASSSSSSSSSPSSSPSPSSSSEVQASAEAEGAASSSVPSLSDELISPPSSLPLPLPLPDPESSNSDAAVVN
eukprot:ANDGO_05078.mRNA.1 hypothetical protein